MAENLDKLMKLILDNLKQLGTSGFLFQGELVIYWNPPPGLKDVPKADIIFLTRGFGDRCLAEDIERVASPHTIVAGSPRSVGRFRLNQLPMLAGEHKTILGIPAEAVSALGPGEKEPGEVIDFVVEIEGVRIYCAGGQIAPPEILSTLRTDIVLEPVSKGIMTAKEALEAVRGPL